MQSISLNMDEVHGAQDGYISDEDFPPLGPDLPPLSPTRSTAGHVGDNDNLVNGGESDADKENQGDKKRPRRLVNRKPQPKLDAVRLCSDRGLPTLSKHFEQVKFKGIGHEVGDLNRLMSTMEHWAHRLFPKMPFDEVIERIEKLGKKRQVQTCIKKIRLDMPLMDEDFVEQEADHEGSDAVNGHDDNDVVNGRSDDETKEAEKETVSQLAGPPLQTMTTTASDASASLSREQREKMERNKRLAMERRKSKGSVTPATRVTPQSPITADEIQDLKREHADEEDVENELWNNIAMFEAHQRNIWKSLPANMAQKETDSIQTPTGNEMTGTSNSHLQKEQGLMMSKEIINVQFSEKDTGKKARVLETVDIDVGAKDEQIDVERNDFIEVIEMDEEVTDEERNTLEEEKSDKIVETVDVDGGAEDKQIDVERKDSKEVIEMDEEVTDEERNTLEEEKNNKIVETVDVDTENDSEKMKVDFKTDGVGNMSSDLILKWDSESADESMTI